jgi:hypothetical protein
MSRHLSISDLAKVICPTGSRRIMALLRAYCDASFTDPTKVAAPRWTAIAGYVGTDDVWQVIEKQWAEKKDLWGIDEFSVAKILAGRSAVGLSDAETCVRSFGKIISDSTLEGVSAAVHDADWEATYKGERFPHKYHGCVSMLFHIIDQHVGLEFKGDSVAVFLDTDHAPDKALNALVQEWQRESAVIASITFGRRRQYPLLECADLCAGTERKMQLEGGWHHARDKDVWFTTSRAHRHRGAFWSLEIQRRNEEMFRRLEEEQRRQRDGEG